MDWLNMVNGNPLDWLLEEDDQNPGVRYSALVTLLDYPQDAPEVIKARQNVMTKGPVPIILAAQNPEGYWDKPGAGYNPKYTGTVWQIIFLTQLGADPADERFRKACEYVLDNSRSEQKGGFSYTGTSAGLICCLQGNLSAALIDLGWLEDDRLQSAVNWLARSIIGEGIAASNDRKANVRYMRSGNSAPNFVCSANNHLPCAWGAVKSTLALSKIPPEKRNNTISKAIATGAKLLLSTDPAIADYPMGYADKPSRSWFKFGFPVLGYVADMLQNLEAIVASGHYTEDQIQAAVNTVLSKQNQHGRWILDYTYNGKTWADIETKGNESKWVTFRALRFLKRLHKNKSQAC